MMNCKEILETIDCVCNGCFHDFLGICGNDYNKCCLTRYLELYAVMQILGGCY